MRNLILVGAGLGVAWHGGATFLMGAELQAQSPWPGIIAGAITGLGATWHTVWTIRRRGGEESFWHGVVNFVLAIATYSFLLSWLSGAWVGPDRSLPFFHLLIGSMGFAVYALAFALIYYGVFLLPLCFASRTLVWSVASRPHDADRARALSERSEPGS